MMQGTDTWVKMSAFATDPMRFKGEGARPRQLWRDVRREL